MKKNLWNGRFKPAVNGANSHNNCSPDFNRGERSEMKAISYDFSVPVFFEGKIHSVFEKAVNVIISDRLISLTHKKFFNGPNRIVLDNFSDFRHFFLGSESVKFENDELFFSNAVMINMRDSKRWNSSVKKIHVGKIDIDKISFYLKNYLIISPSVIESFKFAVKLQNKRLFNYHLDKLLGLGFGLTPSGDDFLVGFLSASWFFSELKPFDFFLKNVKINYSKTNFISAEYLRYSYEGRISEIITNAIVSVTYKKTDTDFWLNNLVNTGDTSGKDTLFGILTAMEIYNVYNKFC